MDPVLKGIWSEYVYKSMEASVDGIVDFKLEEVGEETKNLIRIRSMRNVGFDSRWHPLKNFEVTREKWSSFAARHLLCSRKPTLHSDFTSPADLGLVAYALPLLKTISR